MSLQSTYAAVHVNDHGRRNCEKSRNIGRLIDTVRDLSQQISRSSESQMTAEGARIFRRDGSRNMPTARNLPNILGDSYSQAARDRPAQALRP